MDARREMLRAQAMVSDILANDMRARNSDLWLILQVWQKKQQIKVYVPYDQLDQMIPAETITRARRHIQNTKHQLLPTDPQVMSKRRIRMEQIREFYGDNSATTEAYSNHLYGIK